MRLVTAGGKREWSAAPDKFPADPIAGTVSLPVETVSTWKRALDHFLIIELWQSGGRLQLRATTREFDAGTGTPSQPVYSQAFQRMR
jgi:hypothetical protein